MYYKEFISWLLIIFSFWMRKAALMLALVSVGGIISTEYVYPQEITQQRIQPPAVISQDILIVDAHVHLNDVAMQLELMKSNSIERAIVFWGRNSDNESLLKAARDYPDKFIPFVSISPERRVYRKLWESEDPKILTMLEEYLKKGIFKGIGEISVTHFPERSFPEADLSPTSSLMKGIMKLAEKYRVPITIHCEITRIREFSELLNEFKKVRVIWAHGGYTPYFLAKRMLENHANLYYELSARTWLNHPRSPDYTIFKNENEVWKQWLELIESNPTRFLVGTDASNHSKESDKAKMERIQIFLKQLSPQTRELVARKNLLGLIQGN